RHQLEDGGRCIGHTDRLRMPGVVTDGEADCTGEGPQGDHGEVPRRANNGYQALCREEQSRSQTHLGQPGEQEESPGGGVLLEVLGHDREMDDACAEREYDRADGPPAAQLELQVRNRQLRCCRDTLSAHGCPSFGCLPSLNVHLTLNPSGAIARSQVWTSSST